MSNFCRDCRFLSDAAKSQHWARWLCTKAPNETMNYVTGELEPYYTCRQARAYLGWNASPDCPQFEAGPNCLSPKEMPKTEKQT